MGRPASARSSTASSASSSSTQQQHHLLPTLEYDPAHPANLRRSLQRNDTELAALEKLHGQIRLLKGAIVREFGEEALLECVLKEKKTIKLLKAMEEKEGSATSDATIADDIKENATNIAEPSLPSRTHHRTHNRLHRLTTAFFLRMKLRRRLLNRLARRLHRVAHSMDIITNSNNVNRNVVISAPLPPRYGDIVRRYLSMEAEESGGGDGDGDGKMMTIMGNTMDSVSVIREKDVMEFVEAEKGKQEARELLMKQRQERRDGDGKDAAAGVSTAAADAATTSAVASSTLQEDAKKDEEEEERDEPMDVDEDGGDTISQEIGRPVEKNSINSNSEVDLLLQCDEEDKPYLEKLVEYEPGYDKLYTVEKTVMPSATTAPTPVPTAEADGKEGDSGDVNPVTVESTETEKPVIKMTMPIVSTIDDHELNDDGLPIATTTTSASKQQHTKPPPPSQQQPTRLPFTLAGSTPSSSRNGPNPKENADEWKRWTTELLDKIPDQVTFDELGVGGPGVVFDLEGRLMRAKKKRKERGEGVGDDGGENLGDDIDEEAPVTNQGKGKVLKKSSSRDEEAISKLKDTEEASDKDVSMEESDAATKEEKGDSPKVKDQERTSAKIDPPKTTKSFSVLPVPSFHYLDLKRIRNLQNEMVKSLQVQRSRERVIKAQSQYDAAYNRSIELQQAKSAIVAELKKVMEDLRSAELSVSKSRDIMYAPALHHWKKRQFQLHDMRLKYGEEQALNRDVSNDIIQDLKDRVCIRVSEELTGTGLGTVRLKTEETKAQSEGNFHREVSATVLGHMVDAVERRYKDMLANHSEFVPPPLLTSDSFLVDHETGETMTQSHARKIGHLRSQVTQLDSLFNEAEKKRCEKWTALNKAKGAGVAQPGSSTANNSTVSKPKPRSRKSTGTVVPVGVGAVVVSSNSRMSYPMQMQSHAQPVAPGYGPASYYDPQRALMASQQQMQARMLIQQQQQQQTQQINHMQNMMAQQKQQLHERAPSGGGMQYQSIPTHAVAQMKMAQYPQPVAMASSTPASPSRSVSSEAVSVRNQPSLLSKYGYGDRYSQSNVNARKKNDGTVVPVSAPKRMPDGTFARPAGRQRKGMEWDAVKGCWYPLAEGQQPSSWSGDDEN